jgi:hypothetical protein
MFESNLSEATRYTNTNQNEAAKDEKEHRKKQGHHSLGPQPALTDRPNNLEIPRSPFHFLFLLGL